VRCSVVRPTVAMDAIVADEDDEFEWEVRDESTPFWQHAVAGSCAGIMEHVGMYPLDTVKTRVQASSGTLSAMDVVKTIWRERGAMGFMRGSTVIGFGCIPAHISLFSSYELVKAHLLDLEGNQHQPMRAAACGASATIAHDAILTPSDVVKQRLQMGGYRGALDCIASTARSEGCSAFYRSLPATLAMNVPYMGLLVASNESLKRLFGLNAAPDKDVARPKLAGAMGHFLTAGVSGGFAAVLTLPLDVVKTRLQTQGGKFDVVVNADSAEATIRAPRYSGIISTMEAIHQKEGMAGFFRGLGPRILLAVPAAAMCWGTYESVRMMLRYCPSGTLAAAPSSDREDSAPASASATKISDSNS